MKQIEDEDVIVFSLGLDEDEMLKAGWVRMVALSRSDESIFAFGWLGVDEDYGGR